MTGVEKLERIESILKKAGKFPGLNWMEADEIKELRKDIKVSDWFIFSGEDETSIEKFYKYMGVNVCYDSRMNPKLEAAIEAGYVRRYQTRDYGRYFTWIKLTAKGKKLIDKARA